MEIGDKIELTEGQQAIAKSHLDAMERARCAFSESMYLLLKSEKRLWEVVREMRPDLDAWELQMEKDQKFLRLSRKRIDA